ncbi:signal peptide-containing protein [Rutstroemia sp. NJR-2017a BVV2]|nr:signal peptide-containing protein [Rutstroemia sp. NJR-2017a BVV2]
MQFLAIPFLALLATSALALPSQLEARLPEDTGLETRADCGRKMPSCSNGKVVGQVVCPCSTLQQTAKGVCDLWICPSTLASTNVVSFLTRILFLSYIKMHKNIY